MSGRGGLASLSLSHTRKLGSLWPLDGEARQAGEALFGGYRSVGARRLFPSYHLEARSRVT